MAQEHTSWQSVQDWYDRLVGDEGHYYHQHVVLPGVLRLLDFKRESKAALLDIACGQGVLARQLPDDIEYYGVDISKDLILAAQQRNKGVHHTFTIGDVAKPLQIHKKDFTHATIILALQNIEYGDKVLGNVSKHLQSKGKCVIVLNHPAYRIPRQSVWQIDEQNKLQYRRVNRYMTSMSIPIQHRGKGALPTMTTWSFHHPLSTYCLWLKEAGFLIESIEEWCSDKMSTGKTAKMENRCRKEFPLFLTITAIKMN